MENMYGGNKMKSPKIVDKSFFQDNQIRNVSADAGRAFATLSSKDKKGARDFYINQLKMRTNPSFINMIFQKINRL